ncbi:MAG: hypothetical protein M3Z08_21000 [Chloroflexota bacterium]|nr:hypothetical protein [Chloroflexota bacterium]
MPNKPEPQAGRKRFLLVALLGGLVIVVGGALLLWQVLASQASPTGQKGAISTPSVEPTKSGPGDPPIYYTTLEQYVAQQLYMSVAQIKTELQTGGRSASMSALAAQKGISPTQLRAILIEAEQRGHAVLVQGGYLTQQQSDAGMQQIRSWDLQTLDTHIKYDFLDH